jgi:hypothetical protein
MQEMPNSMQRSYREAAKSLYPAKASTVDDSVDSNTWKDARQAKVP